MKISHLATPLHRDSRRVLRLLAVAGCLLPLLAGVDADGSPERQARPAPGPIAALAFPHAPNRLLVKFEPGTAESRILSVHAATGGQVAKRFRLDRNLELVDLPKGTDLAWAIATYRACREVLYAEPDYLRTATFVPNDPRFAELWGLENAGQGTGDPSTFYCQGGPDTGRPCLTDQSCARSCADTGDGCMYSYECQGNCPRDGAACREDWECQDRCSNSDLACMFDTDCGGRVCSNTGAACTDDLDCGTRKCQGGAHPGMACASNDDCDDRVCQGGAYPGQACTGNASCGSSCEGGIHDGQVCTSAANCGATCQGGAYPGQACTNSGQCGAVCSAGSTPGGYCTYDSQCGAVCSGGLDNGAYCTYDSQCRGACVGGAYPGQYCAFDSSCGKGCQGGARPGQSCNIDFDCGKVCVGGSNSGSTCTTDFQCGGGRCVGGTCTAGDCVAGACAEGTCAEGTCDAGTCVAGTCSPEGTCGPQPGTCDLAGTCEPAICENPECITHSCGPKTGAPDFDIDAAEAWDASRPIAEVVIASLDSGVDFSHEDMALAWTNPGEIPGNGIDDDANGYVDDVHGWDFVGDDNDPDDGDWHGTFTMGVAAARGNNGIGIAGVTWSARIMALRFLGPTGGSTSDEILAIDYATENGARVINASFGGGGYSQAERDAIARADLAGILFVAAAGNDQLNTDVFPNYPSCHDNPNIVSVAATTRFSLLANFSNYGAVTVDLGAPGEEILSATPYPHKYGYENGTSFAAPYVTGAAAYLLGYNRKLSNVQLKQVLLDSVVPDDSLAGRTVTGGMLNLHAAIDRTPSCPPTTCEQAGAECGTIADGCGDTATCGPCSGTDHCEGNTCVCTPTTCAAHGVECGAIPDECGGNIDCGSCTGADRCVSGSCCTPATCQSTGARCGWIADDCGGRVFCGRCASPVNSANHPGGFDALLHGGTEEPW